MGREAEGCGGLPHEAPSVPSPPKGFTGEPRRGVAGAGPEGPPRGNPLRASGRFAGAWVLKGRILPWLLPLLLFVCWE